jgi:hypothetical protein
MGWRVGSVGCGNVGGVCGGGCGVDCEEAEEREYEGGGGDSAVVHYGLGGAGGQVDRAGVREGQRVLVHAISRLSVFGTP